MPDVFTKEKRSQVMAAIRSSGNKDTEQIVARLLRQAGITGWRRGQKLFGKPDFTFRKQRVALFIDGCFWHGCAKHCRRPSSNQVFWNAKLERNKLRDRMVTKTLRQQRWRVLRVWEHDLKESEKLVTRIKAFLTSPTPHGSSPLQPARPGISQGSRKKKKAGSI